jgi:hypothetical protein
VAAFARPAAQTARVSLCVAVQPVQTSISRGQQSPQWIVSAWTQGGNVSDTTVRLVAAPANLRPEFSFGCGSHDGTPSCDLGAVNATSSPRELEALVGVAATASAVTSVRLTAIASTAHLPKEPTASATITVTTAPGGVSTPVTSASPLSVGNLPYVPGVSSTLSPGGNAAGLFPALTPSGPASGTNGAQKANARTVANTSALPLGAPVVGAQLAGLGVLALAFVLAVTRLSIRKRPALKPTAEPRPGPTGSGHEGTPD